MPFNRPTYDRRLPIQIPWSGWQILFPNTFLGDSLKGGMQLALPLISQYKIAT